MSKSECTTTVDTILRLGSGERKELLPVRGAPPLVVISFGTG